MIRIKCLTKKYGKEVVLRDIELSLNPGYIYGLVGPNGCGKTTLLRCICGFTRPTSGSVTVQGKLIGKDVDFAPSTGIIIENPGFLSHLSARQNLSILAGISGKVSEDRIDEVIRMVGLDPNNKKPVGKYSLGMNQRLGIAQSIMENPEHLILDEPFNALDKAAMSEMRGLFQQLKLQGKTILLVSHYTQEIEDNCDIVYQISDGHLSLLHDEARTTA